MKNPIQLSKRLEAVASFIQNDSYFADIGSDHAYLPAYVCMNNPYVRAIAGEVNQGPLERAEATVQTHQLTNKIDVRLGNGLEVITKHDNIDTITITGMGGTLIKDILTIGKEKLTNIQRIIAQPNNNAYAVRKFLYEHHYDIIDEMIIEENGHIYEIVVGERVSVQHTKYDNHNAQKQLLFGPILMKEPSTTFFKKWQSEKEKLNFVIKQMKQAKEQNHEKIVQFEQQVKWIEEVLS